MENRYAIARRNAEKHSDFIDLIDTNFHSCGFRYPTGPVRAAADRLLSTNDFRYEPDSAGDPDLRKAIAAYYRSAGVPADPDSVIVTASASESYSHIFASRCRPGDRVLLPRPGYPMFEEVAARHGLIVDFYDQRREADWEIDVGALESLVRPRTAAAVLISPNNPTGSIVSESVAVRIGEVCRSHALFLVVDEVFSELVSESAALPRPAALVPDVLTYTINGVSKLFASPELKISWVAVTGPEKGYGGVPSSRSACEDLAIQNDLFLSASSLSQAVALQMFREGLQFSGDMAVEVDRRRRLMVDGVLRIAGLSAIRPLGGIHLPVAIDDGALPPGADDEDTAVSLLERHRLATHPGYLYGIGHPTTLVVSYLAPPDRITEGLARLERYFRSARS